MDSGFADSGAPLAADQDATAGAGFHRDAVTAFSLGCLSFVLAACGIATFGFLGACVGMSLCARLALAAARARADRGAARSGMASAWLAAGVWLAIVISVGTVSAAVWGRDAYRSRLDGRDLCANPRICVGS